MNFRSRSRFHRLGTLVVLGLLAFTDPGMRNLRARPSIPVWDAAAVEALCEPVIAAFRRMKAAMEAKRGAMGIFDEWNRLSLATADLDGPLSLIANVSPDKATRDAADACQLRYAPFQVELFQSETLYRRVKDAKPADAIQRQNRKDLIENFEDGGVTLAPDKRERVKAINREVTDLSQQFAKNVRDDGTKVVFTPAEMNGLPESYRAAQKKDDQGNFVLPLSYPSYFPFLKLATDGAARKRYWLAKANEGRQANIDILDQLVALRLELAKLYGDADYATYVVKRRMAGTPGAVDRFLGEVRSAVAELEKKEVLELRRLKADDLNQPLESTMLDRWDVAYYTEKLKKARYDVDPEALRKYFPTEASVAYTMRVAETLYGIHFVPSNAPVWHPDVRVFDVFDRRADGRDGAFVGTVYLDLFPREGKFNHAAAWPVRPVSTLAAQPGSPGYPTPISALVTNFDRNGLDHGELQTMLHEFGHVMHGVLSKTRYADQAGTSVKRDFVEAPSQMFEEWARQEDALKLFAEVCRDCPQLTHDQIERLEAARKFGRALHAAVDAGGVRHVARDAGAPGSRGGVVGSRGQDAARHRPRHAAGRELRASRQRLRGGVLRLHVERDPRARHAVGFPRPVDEPGRRQALSHRRPFEGWPGTAATARRAFPRPQAEQRGVPQRDRRQALTGRASACGDGRDQRADDVAADGSRQWSSMAVKPQSAASSRDTILSPETRAARSTSSPSQGSRVATVMSALTSGASSLPGVWSTTTAILPDARRTSEPTG